MAHLFSIVLNVVNMRLEKLRLMAHLFSIVCDTDFYFCIFATPYNLFNVGANPNIYIIKWWYISIQCYNEYINMDKIYLCIRIYKYIWVQVHVCLLYRCFLFRKLLRSFFLLFFSKVSLFCLFAHFVWFCFWGEKLLPSAGVKSLFYICHFLFLKQNRK